jgi:hypothetical protein
MHWQHAGGTLQDDSARAPRHLARFPCKATIVQQQSIATSVSAPHPACSAAAAFLYAITSKTFRKTALTMLLAAQPVTQQASSLTCTSSPSAAASGAPSGCLLSLRAVEQSCCSGSLGGCKGPLLPRVCGLLHKGCCKALVQSSRNRPS